MILDAENKFTKEQAVTDSAVGSTDVIDLGSQPADIGVGENLYAVVQVDETLVGAGGSVEVKLETDTESDFSDSPATVQTIGTIPALAVEGTALIARLQPGDYKQYLRMNFDPAQTLSAGKFSGFLVKDIDAFKAYKSNLNVVSES